MNTKTRLVTPFICGLILFPSFILVHECGHFLTGLSLGFDTKLHYAVTTYRSTQKPITPEVHLILTAAGPLVGITLMVAGLVWLWSLRRNRSMAPATIVDWLATSLAFNAGRWLRGFTGPPSSPQPPDEAFVSKALGLPSWLLPYCLALMAVLILAAIIRLHPTGQRLLPFSAIMIGGLIGCSVWTRLLGPIVLP